MDEILKITITILASVLVGGLIGFLLCYLRRNDAFQAQINALVSSSDELVMETRKDMKEARIERNSVLKNQKLVMEQLKTYDEHYTDLLQRETIEKEQKAREEKKANSTQGKLDALKNKNKGSQNSNE